MNAIEQAGVGRPRVAISACLLGQGVRFDGGHKRDGFCCDRLGPHVEWVPICPEVESGLPVPRETLRLVGGPDQARLVGHRTGRDHTDQMMSYARARVAELASGPLDGYVVKKDSPSCGLARVRIHVASAPAPQRVGTGLFTQVLRQQLPGLPITEEGWLNDPGLRECFLHQVFTHHRLRTSLAGTGAEALIEAHAAHKFLLLAHSPVRQRQLGNLVAHVGDRPLAEVVGQYTRGAMDALAAPATPGKHANVLHHILGFLRGVLALPDRREVLELVEEFQAGLHPLGVPLALLAHHVRRSGVGGWLARQVYFQPFPRALAPFTVTALAGGIERRG